MIRAQLFDLSARVAAAPHGQASALVAAFADAIEKSPGTVWRWLTRHAGFAAGRKKRADAGSTRCPEATLVHIAALKSVSLRGTRKLGNVMPTCVAMNVADANQLTVNVGASQINRLMRARRLDVATQAAARQSNTVAMASAHPNQVHQIDPSLCVIFYLHGKQYVMLEEEFNKNKPAALDKIKLKVWRYVRYDHASGSIDVRYFEGAGESQKLNFEFLLHTWGKCANRLSFGVPKMLIWDKGSANISHALCNLLDALGVEHKTHAVGRPWAKGGVECANRIIERHFETLLKVEPVDTLEQLNDAASRWVRDYNANLQKHVDSRIRRASGEPLVRDDLWQSILATPQHLVEMPPRAVCAWFLVGGEQTRTVNNRKISFVHPETGKSRDYDLTPWAEFIGHKMKVGVRPVLYKDGAIRVVIERLGAEALTVEVAPETHFDPYGRAESAVPFGEWKGARHTRDQAAAKQIAAAAYPGANLDAAEAARNQQLRPFAHFNGGQGMVAHAHLGQADLPQRLLPAASALETAALKAVRAVEHAPLDHASAALRLIAQVGGKWTPERMAWLKQRHPDGVPEAQLEAIGEAILAERAPAPLRLVGAAA